MYSSLLFLFFYFSLTLVSFFGSFILNLLPEFQKFCKKQTSIFFYIFFYWNEVGKCSKSWTFWGLAHNFYFTPPPLQREYCYQLRDPTLNTQPGDSKGVGGGWVTQDQPLWRNLSGRPPWWSVCWSSIPSSCLETDPAVSEMT